LIQSAVGVECIFQLDTFHQTAWRRATSGCDLLAQTRDCPFLST